MTQSKKDPDRFESPPIRADCCVCCDIFGLFEQLRISPQEQVVLWNMANKRIGCKSLRDILLLLQRNNNLK